MASVVNIAAYKFASMKDLRLLRAELQGLCQSRRLKGTILLSEEGINLFVAGQREAIDALLVRLRRIPGLDDLAVKESYSETQPFNRMLVKIKREIIAFGVEGIEPAHYTSRRVSALQLKQWLDEGREITLLDTRNTFEVNAGTFENAVPIGVDDFRDFPNAARRLPPEFKDRTLVTFCTGGIRCEKAAPFLEREGFRDVFQLDGGILKYFEECGGAHYLGQCFVFDQRVSLAPNLKVGDLAQCYVCQAILTPTEQSAPEYVVGKSCPRCHRTKAETLEQLLRFRRQAIEAATTPLPGSSPYDNLRPIRVPLRFDGAELLDFLEGMRTHLNRDQWQHVCALERLTCRGEPAYPGRTVRAGECFLHKIPATSEPDVATDIEILHEDDALVIVRKPAPLPMHPCGRFHRNTLTYILDQVYHPIHPRPAHRLDADTSGIVVFRKTREIARLLQPQFENGTVDKTYWARVHGHPSEDSFDCQVPIQQEPGPNGVRLPDPEGAFAATRFRVLKRLEDGTSLLEVTPITGRTNQIRAHLWELELPIVGDPIYLRDRQLGVLRSLSLADPPLCLHALAIEFVHPRTRQRVKFATKPPHGLNEE
ncbi:MAG: sulfurtransferase [Planctomycetota bacterium]